MARLGASGHVLGQPQRLALAAEGRPTAIALASGDSLRAVVARTVRGEVTLDVIQLPPDGGGPARPWPLLDIDAPAAFEVELALAGDVLFYDDIGHAPGDHRVRRATIAWHR